MDPTFLGNVSSTSSLASTLTETLKTSRTTISIEVTTTTTADLISEHTETLQTSTFTLSSTTFTYEPTPTASSSIEIVVQKESNSAPIGSQAGSLLAAPNISPNSPPASSSPPSSVSLSANAPNSQPSSSRNAGQSTEQDASSSPSPSNTEGDHPIDNSHEAIGSNSSGILGVDLPVNDTQVGTSQQLPGETTSKSSNTSVGAIVGACFGVLAFIILVGFLVWGYKRRQKRLSKNKALPLPAITPLRRPNPSPKTQPVSYLKRASINNAASAAFNCQANMEFTQWNGIAGPANGNVTPKHEIEYQLPELSTHAVIPLDAVGIPDGQRSAAGQYNITLPEPVQPSAPAQPLARKSLVPSIITVTSSNGSSTRGPSIYVPPSVFSTVGKALPSLPNAGSGNTHSASARSGPNPSRKTLFSMLAEADGLNNNDFSEYIDGDDHQKSEKVSIRSISVYSKASKE